MRMGVRAIGCDIHIYVEYKQGKKWVSAEAMKLDENGLLDVPYPQRIYSGRNYALFGFLTEGKVRFDNGIYVGKLKGFPKNASKEVRRIYKSWAGDAHTPNYFTLRELMDVDWNKKVSFGDAKEDKGTLKTLFEHFYWDVILRLDFFMMIKTEPENIRIVFWFDN